ncbi:MAG: 50S ribosomal protein L21 [Gammaproteobacteria bacterium]|nr:50S ribosomal protein L21 [Gammaproteobacteria bacterium]
MYAVIVTGGKQYKVEKNDLLKVEQLPLNEGDVVTFEQVLMIVDGDKCHLGNPVLKDGKVLATVVEHGRHRKIHVLKFKRRKHYLKRQGHRQNFTQIKITDISAA